MALIKGATNSLQKLPQIRADRSLRLRRLRFPAGTAYITVSQPRLCEQVMGFGIARFLFQRAVSLSSFHALAGRNAFKLKRRTEGSLATARFQSKRIPKMSVTHVQRDHGIHTALLLFREIAMYHGSPPAMLL